MGELIYLTQAIDNEAKFGNDGYADKIEKQIRSQKSGETLTANIDSPGGEVTTGFRIARALSEHVGQTKAIVTGIAASMMGVMLGFFDYVEGDINSEYMLHKAHVPGTKNKDLTPEERNSIESFNKKAYNNLLNKGVDKDLLHQIFLSDEVKDFYFTAQEAKKIGLIDEITEVKRKNGNPSIIKIAASLNQNAKNKYESYKLKQMGIFSKKKPIVAQVEMLKDDRILLFNSASETIAKGDKLSLVGSNESLKGSLILSSGMKLIVNEENTVESVEEAGLENEITPDVQAMFDEMVEAMAALIARVEALEGGGEEAPSEEEVAAKALEDEAAAAIVAAEEGEEEEEVKKAELTELQDKLVAIKAALKKNTVATDFVLPKAENKGEQQMTMKLSASAERSIAMREAINNKQKTA